MVTGISQKVKIQESEIYSIVPSIPANPVLSVEWVVKYWNVDSWPDNDTIINTDQHLFYLMIFATFSPSTISVIRD